MRRTTEPLQNHLWVFNVFVFVHHLRFGLLVFFMYMYFEKKPTSICLLAHFNGEKINTRCWVKHFKGDPSVL